MPNFSEEFRIMYIQDSRFPLYIYLGDQHLILQSLLQEKGIEQYSESEFAFNRQRIKVKASEGFIPYQSVIIAFD
jgi:hypothetical protein